MGEGKLIVLSGASGVGKGTVLNQMMKLREDLSLSVSATTRSPRPAEQEGVHYYFVTPERFREMIENDELLEYDAHMDNCYGTPWKQLEEKRSRGPVILDIDPKGARIVKDKIPDAVLVFIMPPSMAELEQRAAALALTDLGERIAALEGRIQGLTQAEYEALTPDAGTLYLILPEEGDEA